MRNAAIPILVLVHIVAAAMSWFFSVDRPAFSTAIFFGVLFCQASLVGIWSGLGMTHWALRMMGLTGGTVCLAFELGTAIDHLDVEIFVIVAVPSVLVASVTWVVRLAKGNMRRVGRGQMEDNQEALQFSIRHLMILTFLVACLLAVGKILTPRVVGMGNGMEVALLGLCYAAVALTSVWAMLGSGRPVMRGIFVFLIAVPAGYGGGYLIDGPADSLFWLSTTVIQAALLVGSLYAVRLAGYRFVAKVSAEQA